MTLLTSDARGRVVMTVGPCECHSVQSTHAHHADFPEIHAEGEDGVSACTNLMNLLCRALDSAPSGFRRDAIEQALADVRAVLDQDR